MSIFNFLRPEPTRSPEGHGDVRVASASPPVDDTENTVIKAKKRLNAARDELKAIDEKIAHSLAKFGAAQKPNITPTLEQIRAIEFPKKIKNLAIETNTPLELFAGVSYFLAIKPKADAIHNSRCRDTHPNYNEEFYELCTHLAERHKESKKVYLSKKAMRDFNNAAEYVPTFDPKQHDVVVQRMKQYTAFTIEGDYDLSENIIDWIAATNASWQDMAINGKPASGPFVEDVTSETQFDVKQPTDWVPVWKAA